MIMKSTNDQIKHLNATDVKPPVVCRFYCEPYISFRKGKNYIQYTLHGCLDVAAHYWKSLLSNESELIIDTRNLGGTFEKIDNVSYSEVKNILNDKLAKFGVLIK